MIPFVENISNDITYMTSPNIKATHAFGTKSGSVRAALDIDSDDIVCLKQIHSADILIATANDRGKTLQPSPEGDALITNEPNVALVVFTADCVPILLYDPIKGVIGAVHAGWRGTAADIVGKTVQEMASQFGCSSADIKAAIGPCISKCCYETDKDVADAISSHEAVSDGKYMVDLKKANRLLLVNSGVNDILISDECTSCSCDKYWSHRKTKGKRGTQAAVITLG